MAGDGILDTEKTLDSLFSAQPVVHHVPEIGQSVLDGYGRAFAEDHIGHYTVDIYTIIDSGEKTDILVPQDIGIIPLSHLLYDLNKQQLSLRNRINIVQVNFDNLLGSVNPRTRNCVLIDAISRPIQQMDQEQLGTNLYYKPMVVRNPNLIKPSQAFVPEFDRVNIIGYGGIASRNLNPYIRAMERLCHFPIIEYEGKPIIRANDDQAYINFLQANSFFKGDLNNKYFSNIFNWEKAATDRVKNELLTFTPVSIR